MTPYDNGKPPSLPEYRGRARRETLFWLVIGLTLVGIGLWTFGPRVFGQQVWSGIQSLWTHIPFLTHSVTLYRHGQRVTIAPHPTWVLVAIHALLTAIGWLVLGFSPLLLVILITRFLLRQRRIATMQWTEVHLFQNDVVTPDAMRQLFDQLWDALWPRSRWVGSWWVYRLFVSAPPLTLMIIRDQTVDDRMHILLGTPANLTDRVLAAWQNAYQNVRFMVWPHPIHVPDHQVVRWGFRYRTAIRLVDLVDQYSALPLEVLVQAVAREAWKQAGPLPDFVWQVVWVPIGTGRAMKRLETAAQYATWEENVALQQAADTALQQMGRGRWMTEIRASAPTYDVLQRIISAWGLQNRWAVLRPHNVIVWRQKWVTWMQQAVPRIWPLAGGHPLWSGECAAFFALPTGRLRVADLDRSMTRRMPAPRTLSRDPRHVIVTAEGQDRVGLYPEDFIKNLLLLGIQGSGKSTSLINVFKNAVRLTREDGTPREAVVLFDIGKDTAQAALRLVPPNRQVIWFDPTDPANPWALQPLDATASAASAVTELLETLQEIFGASAVGARSREILGHTFTALLAAQTPDHPYTLRDAYRFLTDEGYRVGLLAQALKNPACPPQTQEFWTVVLPNLQANNPRFWEEAVAPPRNKLDELLRHTTLQAALGVIMPDGTRRRFIDWDRVIRERQVVIVNLDMARMGGRSNVRLFGILITQLLWHAIQRQGLQAESTRIPVKLLYDEAQEYLSPQFLDYLALGRAYGFQTVLATRFLLELKDPALQAGVINLCQNRIIHRIPEPAEAIKLMQQMMTIYINNITLQEEAQALERFMADDIMRLPDYTAICLWQAKGAVQSPFVAQTIDWRAEAHEDWATYHLQQQPACLTVPDVDVSIPSTSDNIETSAPSTPSLVAMDDSPPSGSPHVDSPQAAETTNVDWSVQKLAQRFQLSQSVVEKICRDQQCTLSELAAVLTQHGAERPAFMVQIPGWLADHADWFSAVKNPDGADHPIEAVSSSSTADQNVADDTPWLLDS
ncbi:type IV secretory system conjugative DNA transfer family protein [Sulfobacillus thermosulfidooxidans]|uniref:type IV secretory system conjugative DNA transfer family protein n=1 Tax=Sulfobacillus thermosulfidooxidans TaxID=28034 RepID=UPI0006B46BEF|nr:hypothetical protein [Sulfobacillus thermosulfidooxidans]